jgi:hypothetical protein
MQLRAHDGVEIGFAAILEAVDPGHDGNTATDELLGDVSEDVPSPLFLCPRCEVLKVGADRVQPRLRRGQNGIGVVSGGESQGSNDARLVRHECASPGPLERSWSVGLWTSALNLRQASVKPS